jgi:Homeobox KN domain
MTIPPNSLAACCNSLARLLWKSMNMQTMMITKFIFSHKTYAFRYDKNQSILTMNTMNTMNDLNISYTIANQIFHNSMATPLYHSDRDNFFHTITFAEPEADEIQHELKRTIFAVHKDEQKQKADDTEPKRKSGSIRYSEDCLVVLNTWLVDHLHKPYPNRKQMEDLAQCSGLSFRQVNNWFTNIRKRKLKPKKKVLNRASDYSGEFDYLADTRRTTAKRHARWSFFPPTPPVFKPTAHDCDLPLVTPTAPSQLLPDEFALVDLFREITLNSSVNLDVSNTMEALLERVCTDVLDDASVMDIDMEAELQDNDEEWSHQLIDIFLLEAEHLMKLDDEYAAIKHVNEEQRLMAFHPMSRDETFMSHDGFLISSNFDVEDADCDFVETPTKFAELDSFKIIGTF